MDERTVRVLEYEKVVGLLAQCAVSEPGRALARALQPSTERGRVSSALAETSEALRVMELGREAPLRGLRDVGPHLEQAKRRGLLEPAELLQVADFLHCIERMQAFVSGLGDDMPMLGAAAEGLEPKPELGDAIARSISEDGNVRRGATPELARLNDRADGLERQIRARMEDALRREAQRGTLQEPVIVFRAGRFCLPVQSGNQARFAGLVHDRSDSGATVFMEPSDVVELGNILRAVQLQIAAEVERILRELGGLVAASGEGLSTSLGTLAWLDFVLAKGRLSSRQNACEPEIAGGYETRLYGARHPLVGPGVVPVDVWVGEEFRTLVITGPNTGGKTVTLKTVGLLALMAQSGLHIPAGAGSRVAVWRHIWADIGDEQSIEQSLSTFSGHMTQIVKVISRVDALTRRRASAGRGRARLGALVLLDELGAGTDPTEGAALARAILETLHGAGCCTIATTHYNDLKAFAFESDGIENACVEFDPRTLEPTYRLRIGRAGVSNAMAIAQRLGLPRVTVARAREFMGEQVKQFDEVIGQVEQEHQRARQQTREAEKARREAEALKRRYSDSLEEAERRQREAAERGYEAAAAVLRDAEEQARTIIADLQRQTRQSAVTEQGRQRLAELRKEVEAAGQAAEPEHTEEAPVVAETEPEPEWRVGDLVQVKTLGRDGVILDWLRDGRAEVQVGALRVQSEAADLGPPARPPSQDAAALADRMETRKSYTVAREIDLRGMTVDEAILELDKYLDDAVLARYGQVRVVHGKGTGMLRKGLHEFLRGHAQVRELRIAPFAEGGDGVTEVLLQPAGNRGRGRLV